MKEKVTVRDATQRWVRECFNGIPQSLIDKAYLGDGLDSLVELTPLAVGKYVCPSDDWQSYEVVKIDYEKELVWLDVNGKRKRYNLDEVFEEKDSILPMWGTMWTLEGLDEDWVRDNLEKMAECGFRIYEADELGIFIGIDGAGYDFYESHWIPFYKARGLRWHNVEED